MFLWIPQYTKQAKLFRPIISSICDRVVQYSHDVLDLNSDMSFTKEKRIEKYHQIDREFYQIDMKKFQTKLLQEIIASNPEVPFESHIQFDREKYGIAFFWMRWEGLYINIWFQKDRSNYFSTTELAYITLSDFWAFYYSKLASEYREIDPGIDREVKDILIQIEQYIEARYGYSRVDLTDELWHAHVPAFGLESGAIPPAGIYPDITMELSSNCIKLENGLIVSDTFPYQPIYINESGRRINKACTVKDVLFQDTF